MSIENEGFSLESTPTRPAMYYEANALHIHDFDININFYLGVSFLLAFIR